MEQTKATEQFLEKKAGLKRHLEKLSTALPPALEHAFDRYFETQVVTYLKIEAQLGRFEGLILKLGDQLAMADTMADLRQTAGRLAYVADRMDELEAVLYRRPKRRSRFSFNLSDFFNHFQNNQDGSSPSQGEIHSLDEAYQILNLEEGCTLFEVMAAFRRLAKRYHPDARGGDRSDERHLRQVVEAYQIIRESLKG